MDQRDILKSEALPAEHVDTESHPSVSAETLRDLGEFLAKRFKELKELRERSAWEKEKAEALEAYHMAEKNRPLPWAGAANLSCVLPRIGVDTCHAYTMQAIFGKENRAQVYPKWSPKDFQNTSRRAANYMSFVLEHEANLYEAFDDADRKCEMFGIGYLEPYYVREKALETVEITEEKNELVVDPTTGQPELKTTTKKRKEKKERVIFDGTKVESIPVENIYTSPFLRTLEDAVENDVVFKWLELTLRKMEDRSRGENSLYIKSQVDEIKDVMLKRRIDKLSDLEQARARLDGFFLHRQIQMEKVQLVEAHLWYDIDGDDIAEKITATFEPESGIVVRYSFAPMRIVALNARPVDERFYGEGIPKIGRFICVEWEMAHNQRMNKGQWENTPFGFYRAGGRFNPQTIQIAPGQFYPVDNPQEVAFAQPPVVGASYFQEEQLLVRYFETIFGTQNFGQTTGRQTATKQIQESQKAQVMFSNPLARKVMALEKLVGHIWDLNRECAPKEKEFFIAGAGNSALFDKVTSEDYNVQLKFRLGVSTIFDEQMARDTAMLVYRLFIQNPLVQMNPAVLYDLTMKSLDSLKFDLAIPKPPQSRAIAPLEEHEMLLQGKEPEPIVGEDYEEHLEQHMHLLESDKMKEWPKDAIQRLIIHIDKTKLLKGILQSANLNQSGKYDGPSPMGGPQAKKPAPGQPPVNSGRNPSGVFNNMRVGEGSGNGNTQETLASVTGQAR